MACSPAPVWSQQSTSRTFWRSRIPIGRHRNQWIATISAAPGGSEFAGSAVRAALALPLTLPSGVAAPLRGWGVRWSEAGGSRPLGRWATGGSVPDGGGGAIAGVVTGERGGAEVIARPWR